MSMQEAALNSRAATNALHRISVISQVLAVRIDPVPHIQRRQHEAFVRDILRLRQQLEDLRERAEILIAANSNTCLHRTIRRSETS